MTPASVIALVALPVVLACVVLAALATRPGRHWLVVPGVAAVGIVIVLGVAVPSPAPNPWIATLLALGLAALGVLGGSPLVALILRLAARGSVTLGAHGGILVRDSRSPAPTREVLRGGATIGYLERLALIGCVIAGQPAAVAVIVAVKGLGRYSELEDAQARERFIIGTLASLIWAGACTAAIQAAW